VALILVVSPSCAACNHPDLPQTWQQIKSHFAAETEVQGVALSTSGVAITPRAAAGWKFLTRFGEFHEVAAGKLWQNEFARKYFGEGFPGPLAVPQVVLVTRESVADHAGYNKYVEETVVERHKGLSELFRWSDQLSTKDGDPAVSSPESGNRSDEGRQTAPETE